MQDFERSRLFNPEMVHENRLPARATVIPAHHSKVYYKNKDESELILNLNGDYKFNYSESDTIPSFYEKDFDDTSWDTLQVPSMWQYHGYSAPLYPNVEYPIPFIPPYVGNKNPVGYYRKRFNATTSGKKILYFGGVDSAFFVYLNGEYVGFSKGSRMPAEFDVTPFLVDGENILAVKVFTYCDGTYLENQDMLLASGIFRDVFLYNLDHIYVWDYCIRTERNKVFADITVFGDDLSNIQLKVSLDGQLQTIDASNNNSFVFELDNPTLWNAENPFTYEITIELLRNNTLLEMHTKKFGFAEYIVEGNKLMLNSRQITIKGINRHEHDPKNGRAITVDLIEKELKIIKQHNMNAIRCAHYPNNPAFYEIATELGLYVMNEADIESHGSYVCGDMGYFAKQPNWYGAFHDRVERMYERDKNETCIAIWTIGNENGEGENIDKCVNYLRTRSVKKPIMHTGEDYQNPVMGDFRSEGYFDMEALESHPEEGKPVMLLEYGHAMGNSPGLMEDTWDYVYKNRQICGGFVWEFKNHGFYCEDENGTPFYKYGGDFGDINHWSNFSLDGYCLSDGTIKPSLRDCKNVLAPTYITYDGEKITLMNTNDFKALDYITLKWELSEDYHVLKTGEFTLPSVKPYESTVLDITAEPDKLVAGAKYFINMRFYNEENEEIAFKQVLLSSSKAKEPFEKKVFDATVAEKNQEIWITFNGKKIGFKNGLLFHYEKDDKILLDKPMNFTIYRAPIDNDGVVGWNERWITKWHHSFLRYFEFITLKTQAEKQKDCVIVKTFGKWTPISKFTGFDIELTYTVTMDGSIITDIHAVPYGGFYDALPRIGVFFTMSKEFDDVMWYGRGEEENYSDRKAHCNFGLYQKNIGNMNFIYDVPQECGTRIDNSFVSVKNATGSFSVIGSDSFTFSYHDFSLEDLIRARHRNELIKSKENYLYIDYVMRGLGSHSCGPNPEDCYELHPHEFQFAFVISSETKEEKLLELSRKNFGVKTKKLSSTYVYEEKEQRKNRIECNINNY